MKWTYVLAAVAFLMGVLCLRGYSGTDVRVVADGVNLRVTADAQAKVLLQVDRDEILNAHSGLDAPWIKVVPPSRATLWVHADLVKDDKVIVKRLRVRAGPGISYKPVGTIEQGAQLQSRGRKGDWLMIAPPTNTYVYVSREYVKAVAGPPAPPVVPPAREEVEAEPSLEPMRERPVIAPPAGPEDGEPVPVAQPVVRERPEPEVEPIVVPRRVRPPAKPIVTPERPAVAEPPPAWRPPEALKALQKKGLDASMPQGERVTYRGTLKPAGFVWRRPSKYRLTIAGRKGRVCYVFGVDPQLSTLLGKVVELKGREYWLRGVRYAVVVPEQIAEQKR